MERCKFDMKRKKLTFELAHEKHGGLTVGHPWKTREDNRQKGRATKGKSASRPKSFSL